MCTGPVHCPVQTDSTRANCFVVLKWYITRRWAHQTLSRWKGATGSRSSKLKFVQFISGNCSIIHYVWHGIKRFGPIFKCHQQTRVLMVRCRRLCRQHRFPVWAITFPSATRLCLKPWQRVRVLKVGAADVFLLLIIGKGIYCAMLHLRHIWFAVSTVSILESSTKTKIH